MKLGIVARGDNTGLGIQSWEAVRYLEPTKVLLVDICHLSPKKLTLHPERFPNAVITKGFPTDDDIKSFLVGLDVVLTFETPYSYSLFVISQEMGVKAICLTNAEFNDYVHQSNLPRPSLFAAPTYWMYDSIPEPKVLLPVPVALDRFTLPGSQQKTDIHNSSAPRPTSFLHTVGHPAIHDRNGTKDLLAALPYVTQNCNVTIKAQDTGYLTTLGLKDSQTIGNVTVVVDTSSPENYWEVYRDAEGVFYDALVLPRRYGGLCLGMNEALAAGMPVIMPNISPNDDHLPSEWLTPARRYGKFMAKQSIDLYRTRRQDLAAKLDDFCVPDEPHSYLHYQKQKARALAEMRSWDRLRPKYLELFTSLVEGERK